MMFDARGDGKVHARIIDRRLTAAFSAEFVTARCHARLPTSSDLPTLPPTSTSRLVNYEHIIALAVDNPLPNPIPLEIQFSRGRRIVKSA